MAPILTRSSGGVGGILSAPTKKRTVAPEQSAIARLGELCAQRQQDLHLLHGGQHPCASTSWGAFQGKTLEDAAERCLNAATVGPPPADQDASVGNPSATTGSSSPSAEEQIGPIVPVSF